MGGSKKTSKPVDADQYRWFTPLEEKPEEKVTRSNPSTAKQIIQEFWRSAHQVALVTEDHVGGYGYGPIHHYEDQSALARSLKVSLYWSLGSRVGCYQAADNSGVVLYKKGV